MQYLNHKASKTFHPKVRIGKIDVYFRPVHVDRGPVRFVNAERLKCFVGSSDISDSGRHALWSKEFVATPSLDDVRRVVTLEVVGHLSHNLHHGWACERPKLLSETHGQPLPLLGIIASTNTAAMIVGHQCTIALHHRSHGRGSRCRGDACSLTSGHGGWG